MTVAAETLKRTPLYECHVEARARLVQFAGWEMPVQYEGVRQEHTAVRERSGLFDVSHMGEIEFTGPQAQEFLRHLVSNDISKTPNGSSQYSLLCRPDGGVLDDLFTYRFADDRFLSVVNASNADSDFDWIAKQAAEWEGLEVVNRSADFAMLAFQGPEAIAQLSTLVDRSSIPERFGHAELNVGGIDALVCRTGYTGEDGVELLVAPDAAAPLWQMLVDAGAAPAGLGARDTLRLEVCYALYGNDLSTDRSPIEAGLGWACALDKDFIGANTLREQKEHGTAQKLTPFTFTGKGIPRAGCAVLKDGKEVGTVTSGTLSPSLDIGIGMAYIATELSEPGHEIEIDVRGKTRPAVTAAKPLYRKD